MKAVHPNEDMIRMRQRLGDRPVLVGPSAAWALGCQVSPPELVHVGGVTPRTARGLVAHRTTIDPADVVVTRLGSATSPVRTALDLARGLGGTTTTRDQRVVLVDALLHATSLPVAAARERAWHESGIHGLLMARRVLALARDGAQSPKETELRLLLGRLGWPEAVLQCEVSSTSGHVVAHLDLGWPAFLVGVEYDGAVHRDAAQHRRDMDRHNAIRRAGWVVLQVGPRLLRNPRELTRQLHELVQLQQARVA